MGGTPPEVVFDCAGFEATVCLYLRLLRCLIVVLVYGCTPCPLHHSFPQCMSFPRPNPTHAQVETALETAANGGKVILIGMGCAKRNMSVPLLPAAIREVDLLGSFRYRNTYPTALSLIASGRIDVKPLITNRIDLSAPGAFEISRVTEAFRMAEKGGDVIKVMFSM